MMQDVLANLLLAAPDIVAIVARNIDWDVSPAGTVGARITMQVISDPRQYTTRGAVRFYTTRIQFNCLAATAVERRALVEALEKRLSGFEGRFAGIQFDGVFQAGARTGFNDNGAVREFGAQVDYIFHWAPAQP